MRNTEDTSQNYREKKHFISLQQPARTPNQTDITGDHRHYEDMSLKYQDFQNLQEDTKPNNGPRLNNPIHQAIMMSRRIPEPSSGFICTLSAICTGLIFIIIILVVTMTRQGVDQTKYSLEVKLRNLSIEVHSRVDLLYEESYRMMEKLTDFESFMKDFRKHNVTSKVMKIEELAKSFLSDEITGSLVSDNQRILAAVGLLTDGIRNKNGTIDPLCDPDWTHFSLKCYYLSRNARPWDYAKKICDNKKGHLVVINNLEEMNFLRNLSQSESLWIGLSSEDGIWKWVDGTSYENSLKFWKSGEPHVWFSLRQSMCSELEGEEGWTTTSCSTSYQYVCEKKIREKK